MRQYLNGYATQGVLEGLNYVLLRYSFLGHPKKHKMRTLTRCEFLTLLNLTSGAFDQLRHAGYVALAFGTPMPATPGRYLDLDLVAVAINLGLTPSLGRPVATAVVGGFFQQWAAAVGYAELDTSRDFFMAVGGIGWNSDRSGQELTLVTHGTLHKIAQDFDGLKDVAGYVTVNVSQILRRLRRRARSAGIDLSSPFFFAPDDPQFADILAQVTRERDARIKRFRHDKKKRSLAKLGSHHPSIEAMARVKHLHYPVPIGAVG